MQQKLLIFTDCNHNKFRLIQADDSIDIQAAYQQAVQDAESDQLRFRTSDVPESYLAKYGLFVQSLDTVNITEQLYGRTKLEQTGICQATCRNCNSFIDGFCDKYGSVCDPDDYMDCVHSDNTYVLSYTPPKISATRKNGPLYSTMLQLSDDRSEQSDLAIVNAILNVTENNPFFDDILRILERPDYDPKYWVLENSW